MRRALTAMRNTLALRGGLTLKLYFVWVVGFAAHPLYGVSSGAIEPVANSKAKAALVGEVAGMNNSDAPQAVNMNLINTSVLQRASSEVRMRRLVQLFAERKLDSRKFYEQLKRLRESSK